MGQASVLFARVAVPVPLGRAFTYSVPPELEERIARGARVLVELGRRKVIGVVLEVTREAPDVPPGKLKSIAGEVDGEPALQEELLGFLLELARYYLGPVGEVMRLALPALERKAVSRLEADGLLKKGRISAVGRLSAFAVPRAGAALPERATEGQRALWQVLEAEHGGFVSELDKRFKGARRQVKGFVEQGLVTLEERQRPHPLLGGAVPRDRPPDLTPHQKEAVEALIEALDVNAGAAFLLDGVTASGKTEVYLHAVAHCLTKNKGAIVLVPEIALTPQLVSRFRARLGDSVAVLHSALTETERLSMWRRLRDGSLRIAIGARSALFAPVQDLALICVDEEHDGSFKQEEGIKYNARDMALLRAHRASAVCVLGSATPSLASEIAVQRGRMRRLKLPGRAHRAAVLPQIQAIDLRQMGPGPTGDRLLSLPLFRALEETLAAGQQAILFLNRRGFAPSLICDDCGKILECPHCSVALTLHRARGQRLECHYCDYSMALPEQCPHCRGTLNEEGLGTERVESLITKAFPQARVARLDRDVAQGVKGEKILDRVRAGEVDVLVGTQMVTKGHDLPRVTLVGVLNADAALSLPDFRAAERCFHLLVQVAGRAGRGDQPGKVLIQTRQPTHPAVSMALSHDVPGFVRHELAAREELGYPPFSHLALVRVDGARESEGLSEVTRLAELVRRHAEPGVEVLGPSAAPLARLRNRYRFRFMLRAESRPNLRKALLQVARAAVSPRVRVVIDIDPVNML